MTTFNLYCNFLAEDVIQDFTYFFITSVFAFVRLSASRIILPETNLSPTNSATHLCKCNGVAVLKHVSVHMCYHAEFFPIGRSALKGVGFNTEEPPKLGSAGTPLS